MKLKPMGRLLFLLVVCGGGRLGGLSLAAEPCVTRLYVTPGWLDPNDVDPNAIILSPHPDMPESNDWTCALGKYNRTYAQACHPQGFDFDIELVEWTGDAPPTLHHDKANGRWSLAHTTRPGLNRVTVRATDEFGGSRLFAVLWRGRDEDNQGPVLH